MARRAGAQPAPHVGAVGGSSLSAILQNARKSGALDLSDKNLVALPIEAFHLEDLPQPPSKGPAAAPAAAFSSSGAWWEVSELSSLVAARNLLTALPPDVGLLTALTVLTLAHNRLASLPSEVAFLPQLRSLDVTSNALESLPEGPYPRLARIRVGANRIRALPEGLARAANLAELSAPDNALAALCDLRGCSSLTALDVSGNRISDLPPLPASLTDLNAARNQLRALPQAVASLTRLVRLDVRDNKLSALPEALGGCKALVELFAGRNGLSHPAALAPELAALALLRTLDLSNARLTAFPKELCATLRLATLDLSNNDLVSVPSELGRMASLRRVALEGNPIKAIRQGLVTGPTPALLQFLASRLDNEDAGRPEVRSGNVFGADEAVAAAAAARHAASRGARSLSLAKQNLSEVPAAVLEAIEAGVEEIDLSGNPLGPRDENILEGVAHRLRALTLAQCRLTAWPVASAGPALPLRSLTLGANPALCPAPLSLFQRLSALESLDLSGCPLAAGGLPRGALLSMPLLKDLRLARCGLQQFPVELLEVERSPMAHLDLGTNRISNLPEEARSCLLRERVCPHNSRHSALTRTRCTVVLLLALSFLDVSSNDIANVPPLIGRLGPTLKSLLLEGNPIRNIRRPVLDRGTPAVLAFLLDRIPA